ncbi:hypothetical protein EDB83DRAFT_2316633 [Lactarius deliciosus]|nr:hypothetical protein EDB83DRAFT_2316633 [Lactarius deliciosus]
MSTPQNTPSLSLADCISSDSPIPLADRISGPADSSDDTSIRSGSPAPSQQTFGTTISRQPSPIPIALPADFPDFNTPDSPVSEPLTADLPGGVHMMGYERYNSYNPNHYKYAPDILMPDGVTQKKLHYVAFHINTYTHRHTVVGCRNRAGDPLGDYGEDLYAAPNWDPMPNTVDNNDLTLLTPTHPDTQAVDIATSALKDPGVTADIDRYRVLWDTKGALEQREQDLKQAWNQWRDHHNNVQHRLVAAQTHSRLHPYLQGQAYVANIRDNTDLAVSAGIPIADVLHHRVSTPPYTLPFPQLHEDERAGIDRWAQSGGAQSHVSTTIQQPHPSTAIRLTCSRCKIPGVNHRRNNCPLWDLCSHCDTSGHQAYKCAYPHSLCYRYNKCYISSAHQNFGQNGCPWHASKGVQDPRWTTGEWDAYGEGSAGGGSN